MNFLNIKAFLVVSGRMYKNFLKKYSFEMLFIFLILNVLFKFPIITVLLSTLILWGVYEVLIYLKLFGKNIK